MGGGFLMKIHIVQADDTLAKLAKKYHISEEQIVKANPTLEKEQPLQTGSKIFIPSGKIPLTKENERKEDQHNPEHHLEPELDQDEYPIESSYRQAYVPDPAVRFEDQYPEPVPYPTGWAPYPPMPPSPWGCSYVPMFPANPYYGMGQIHAFSFPTYYGYPYTYGPSLQNFDRDPYDDQSYSDESSSYYTRSTWDDPKWLEKESSSVEG